jgi:hypothetical protein
MPFLKLSYICTFCRSKTTWSIVNFKNHWTLLLRGLTLSHEFLLLSQPHPRWWTKWVHYSSFNRRWCFSFLEHSPSILSIYSWLLYNRINTFRVRPILVIHLQWATNGTVIFTEMILWWVTWGNVVRNCCCGEMLLQFWGVRLWWKEWQK